MTLLDDWLPVYEFSERHQIVCRADPARTWAALHQADLADSRLLVMGLAGRFWTASGGRIAIDGAAFRGPIPPGTARVAWNFLAEPQADGATLLRTETRIACAGAAARRRFRAYWFVIRPGSGLIRRAILRAVRAHAERPERQSPP